MRITMRIREDPSQRKKLEEFGEFLLRVGDNTENTFPERGEDVIQLTPNIISDSKSNEDFVDEIFPNITHNFTIQTSYAIVPFWFH